MKNATVILIIILVLFIACSRFISILQPDTAQINSMFDVPITITLEPSTDSDAGSKYWAKVGYLAIQLPIGWAVEDSIPYNGVHNGIFTYSELAVESITSLIPPRQGYYWWASVSDSVNKLSEGNISFTPKIHTGDQAGLYFLDYYVAKRLDSLSEYLQIKSILNPVTVDLPKQATVTNTNDSGPRSLREALSSVSSGGEITFDLTYPDTIVLDSQLVVGHKVTINGPEDGDLVISGNDSTRIFYIDIKADVHINNISLTHGAGSAIYCIGKLNLDRVRLCRNQGVAVEVYGNIFFEQVVGSLYANKCTIVNNDGVGIYLGGFGTATVVNSILWGKADNVSKRELNAVAIYYSLSDLAPEEGNPIFVDTIHDDYHLVAGSAGIDAGIQDAPIIINEDTVLVVPPMAYLGDAPDMGAYEFDPATAITDIEKTPARYSLYQNYPNPFNPETMIHYQLPMTSYVELAVFNILGQKVATLVSGKKAAGNYSVKFNASNLAGGIYFYTLKSGNHISHKKMLLIK